MHDDRRLSVADAARRLGRSTEQIRRYLREGRLTGQRIGGQWFIDRDVLDSFQSRSKERKSFLQRLATASEIHALDDVIAIGEGPGTNLGEGKVAYRSASWWRR